ncbi:MULTISPECIES: protein translocase subunit SecD [Streptomyces]|uniref:Protein translocase subunit SecD n=1 Tax=Streptomyces griseiscabiei TaxID=2993540 RepID=A0ABU4LKI0_9ACTN|nr:MULTISPECIES: protein translocase subunit SecD [Streptomyces]MBZ3902418.1 protein translocase subunit SecD [Streptomyces griseiscabiei]MDX2916332.1 protein translocase subunit SecD [Streptomyces griseiscabiei]
MAAPKKGRSASAQSKPGRALALILIALVALTGGMFASGHTKPRLGIDLAGGTSITLTAINEPGQPNAINKTNMDTAVEIMNRRVNGLGVSEAEVQTQGNENIIVNIPKGTDSEEARDQVGTTAKLYFRPVLQSQVGSGATETPSASPSTSASGSGSPSPSSSDGKDEANPPADDSASPSSSATSQGRALTDALKADPTPSGSGSASAKASDSASPSASPSVDPETQALQAKFAALDCNDPKQRAAAGKGKTSDVVVACGQDNGSWSKFVLGPVGVDGTEVEKAQALLDTQSGTGWQVVMDFDSKGEKKFADITGQLATQTSPQNEFAIVLDDEVVSHPYVRAAVTGGKAEISGSFTQEEAQNLANMLSYGALPLTFKESSVTTVSPALGDDQLHAGLIAGAIGLALVMIYLVVYYRGLSLIAIASLLVSAALTYVLMALLGPAIGFALNLPAVCGAIVAIGITADSFIVYFERVRDEIREGRSLRPAVERAWPRARRTILVSDFVSFLSAAVLFVVTVGKVQGFAFTLGLTTLLDVVVVFFFTKPLLTLLARTKFFGGGHKWSGLDPQRLGARPPLRRTRRPAVPSDPKEA